jgi:hypothetical protein
MKTKIIMESRAYISGGDSSTQTESDQGVGVVEEGKEERG